MHRFQRSPFRLLLPLAWGMMAGLASGQARSAAPAKLDCDSVIKQMKADFAREPGRLLLALEDALTSHEACVCPIVRTAIHFAGTDRDLVGQVVITAIRMVPPAAALIAECATAQAPDAASAIRLALSQELGEKGPALLDSGRLASEKPPTEQGSPAAGAEAAGEIAPPGKTPGSAPALSNGMDAGAEAWPAVGLTGIYYAPMPRSGFATGGGHRSATTPAKAMRTVNVVAHRPVSPFTRSSPN